jgi:glycerol-3-phosphate acyltransferase PlsY
VGKGVAAVVLARLFGTGALVVPAAALAALLGHVFSMFLRFSGGKGVATGLGICLAVAPGATVLSMLVFGATFAATHIVSVASLAGVWVTPLTMALVGAGRTNMILAVLIGVIITERHQENIRRIRAGIEPRFQDRGSPPSA